MTDLHINKGVPMLNRDIDYVLQQIDMLFDTSPREVLGDLEYGTQYDRYLYNLNISNTSLENNILSDLQSLDLKGFEPGVTIIFLKGTENDIALIDITLNKNYESYRRIYKIFDKHENI